MADALIPIGVFWDIENCHVPKWKSALSVVQRIRDQLFGGHREVEFMCVCDINKESKDVIQELNSGQVNVVHVNATSKNAADDKIRQCLRRFADTHPPKTKIILISSDVNFTADLSDLRHRKNFHIILIHQRHVHEALLACANEHYVFDDIVQDLPCRSPSKTPEGITELEVKGFSPKVPPEKIRSRLKILSTNCGGRVVSVTPDYALLRFAGHDAASRARKRMEGEDVYGNKITVDFPVKPDILDSAGLTIGEPRRVRTSKPDSPSQKDIKDKRHCSPAKFGFESSKLHHSPYKGSCSAPVASYDCCDQVTEEKPVSVKANLDSPSQRSKLERRRKDSPSCCLQSASENGKKPNRGMLMLQQQMYQERQQTRLTDTSPRINNHRISRPNSATYEDQLNNRGYKRGRNNSGSCRDGRPNSAPYNYCVPPFAVPAFSEYQRNYDRDSPTYQNQSYGFSSPSYLLPYQNSYYSTYQNNYHLANSFQPISSQSPPGTGYSQSNVETSPTLGPVELVITNLDYNISAKEWRKILFTTFHPHVKVLNVHIKTQVDNTCIGMIKVPSVEEARFAISQFHRKKIGYKRIQVTLKSDDGQTAAANIRAEAIALLLEAKGNVLPLFKFIELFDKRYHRSISVSELYKMKDTLDIREQGGAGRMVYLAPGAYRSPSPQDPSDQEIQEILEQPVCSQHCLEGSAFYTEAMNSSMLPHVRIQMKTFATQVHTLLQGHNGNMPLMSFPACYAAEFSPLLGVKDGGVPLEHLISCVPGIQIQVSCFGVKKVQWLENKAPPAIEFGRQCNSPLLSQQLSQISREVTDLLKHSPQCRMPVSKFIPAYHHHFGRQCRVADYGYTKLMELFEAIPHVLQVLGTGDRKILTLSHRAQVRRFTADLLRVLKGQPGKHVTVEEFPEAFAKVFGKPWDVTQYGACYLEDLLIEIPPSTVMIAIEGPTTFLSIPKRDQTSEEIEKTKQFALEVVDLLKHNPQCRMPFNKFIPAYHHHFGKQCKVADYGFSKLTDLFESIPQVVEIEDEGEERILRLTQPEMRKVLSEQIVHLLKIQPSHSLLLEDIPCAFIRQYSFAIRLEDFGATSVRSLIEKLRHIVKTEVYNNQDYVVLLKHTELPPLALRVLQLLMDQSSGCLPLVELCSWYETTFASECDVQKIKEELVDFVQVSGDDGSAVIRLTALQSLARDIRLLLLRRGKVPLFQFEQMFSECFGVEIKPALYGFTSLYSLLQALPHILTIKGKGSRKCVQLSNCLKMPGSVFPATVAMSPRCFSSEHRNDSDTPSNDSGVTDSQDDDVIMVDDKISDLLYGPVPSAIPSPELQPSYDIASDLMKFDSQPDHDSLWCLTEEEKRGQKTPLCRTPTSELLQFAAQCLVTHPPADPADCCRTGAEVFAENKEETICLNSGVDSQQGPTGDGMDTLAATCTLSQTDSEATSAELGELLKGGWWKASPAQLHEVSKNFKVPTSGRGSPSGLDQLTTGDSVECISKVNDESVLLEVKGNLENTTEGTVPATDGQSSETPSKSYDTDCEAVSHRTCQTADNILNISYDGMFRQETPIDTSSTKSGAASVSGTPLSSPRKSRSRIAARFNIPLQSPKS